MARKPHTEWDRQTKVTITPEEMASTLALLRSERPLYLSVEVRATRSIVSFQPPSSALVDGEQYQIRFFNTRTNQTWYVTRTHFA